MATEIPITVLSDGGFAYDGVLGSETPATAVDATGMSFRNDGSVCLFVDNSAGADTSATFLVQGTVQGSGCCTASQEIVVATGDKLPLGVFDVREWGSEILITELDGTGTPAEDSDAALTFQVWRPALG